MYVLCYYVYDVYVYILCIQQTYIYELRYICMCMDMEVEKNVNILHI